MAKRRAALYARVSSDDRDNEGRNLKGQIELCREYALSHGFEIVAELSEDESGASGAELSLPQLDQALEMAADGRYDCLIVRELDRLARNLAKQLYVEQQLTRAGVDIRYALYDYPDTPEGKFQKNVRAIVAELEREKIIERTIRGRRHAVRGGSILVGASPPYGYKVVKEGGKIRLQIYEPEAYVVRLIFAWYTEGDENGQPVSINDIARKLSGLHLPSYADTRRGKWKGKKKRPRGEWSRMSVYYIVHNATYSGWWRFGKTRQVGGHWVKNPDDYTVEAQVPAIISPEVWARAQEQTAQNSLARSAHRRYTYLLGGRAHCSCGRKLVGTTFQTRGRWYRLYRCRVSARHRRKLDVQYVGTCDLPVFPVDAVDAAVWAWLRSWLLEPEQLAQGLREYQTAHRPMVSKLSEQAQALDELLAARRAELRRALDLYLSGGLLQELLVERKGQLEIEIRSLEQERARLTAMLSSQSLTEDRIENLQRLAARFARGLDLAGGDFETRRRIVDLLDVQATFAVEGEEQVVYVSCTLGETRLLSRCNNAARPGRPTASTPLRRFRMHSTYISASP